MFQILLRLGKLTLVRKRNCLRLHSEKRSSQTVSLHWGKSNRTRFPWRFNTLKLKLPRMRPEQNTLAHVLIYPGCSQFVCKQIFSESGYCLRRLHPLSLQIVNFICQLILTQSVVKWSMDTFDVLSILFLIPSACRKYERTIYQLEGDFA